MFGVILAGIGPHTCVSTGGLRGDHALVPIMGVLIDGNHAVTLSHFLTAGFVTEILIASRAIPTFIGPLFYTCRRCCVYVFQSSRMSRGITLSFIPLDRLVKRACAKDNPEGSLQIAASRATGNCFRKRTDHACSFGICIITRLAREGDIGFPNSR